MNGLSLSSLFAAGGTLVTIATGTLATVLNARLGASAASQAPAPAKTCRAQGTIVTVSEIPEASGIAVSRKDANRLWAHNDSGDPILFALDTRGVVTGRLRLSGAAVEDWEAVAVGPCLRDRVSTSPTSPAGGPAARNSPAHANDRITDGNVSSDGQWICCRAVNS